MISVLKDIIEVIETGKREKGGSLNEGIPSIGAEHLQSDGHINWSESSMRYISPSFFDTMKSGKLKIDDVLLVKDGATTGKVAYVDDIPSKNAAINEHVFLIRPRKRLLSKYLYYYLRSPIGMSKVLHYFHGAAIGGISRDFLNVEIKVPSLLKQEDVIRQLSNSEDVLQICNQLLAKFDTLVKSRFIEMFGDIGWNEKSWKTERLEDICDSIGDGLHGTPEYDTEGIIPFINGNNLDRRIIQTISTKYVNENEYNRLHINLSSNAILMSINGTLGKLAYYHGEKVCLGKSAAYFNVRSSYNRIFVYELMRTERFQEYLESNSTKSTIKNVGLKALRNYRIIVPPIDLQNQFAAFVEQVDKSKAVLHKLLEKQELLRAALMQEYFGY